jgi:hypothetical protein
MYTVTFHLTLKGITSTPVYHDEVKQGEPT